MEEDKKKPVTNFREFKKMVLNHQTLLEREFDEFKTFFELQDIKKVEECYSRITKHFHQIHTEVLFYGDDESGNGVEPKTKSDDSDNKEK